MNKLSGIILFLLFLGFSYQLKGQVIANNENLITGPSQKIRFDVTRNNNIPCDNYSLSIISVTPSGLGTATFVGDYFEFTPAAGISDQTIDIVYSLSCPGGGSDQATISVYISTHNLPLNIVQTDEECIDEMSKGLPFGIKMKFQTENGAPPNGGYRIDGFTSPVVGDLNDDGKPEIVMIGVTGDAPGGARNTARYINIYNGQDGARMYRYNLGADFPQSSGTGYHRPPSALALADLDYDGIGEIVYTRPDGNIMALKPILSDTAITGLSQMWTGNIGGTSVNIKSPVTSTAQFQVPSPYIVDINGDGTPEVVVYNKIFHGVTGELLMSWQAAAASATASSITSASGLRDNRYADPTTQTNAGNIRSVAMTGRRPTTGAFADEFVSVPAIWDIDGDGTQEIITGNRIHKVQINSLTDHTQNTYTTIEGPEYADLNEGLNGAAKRLYLSDGHTRVADIDDDGFLDIIVVSYANNGSLDVKILVYVWDYRNPSTVKAALTYYSDGANGNVSIPFVGDINGIADGWDGTAYTKKLPEICILAAGTYINRTYATANTSGRTGILFHPLSDESLRRGTAGNTGTGAGWDNNQTANTNRRFNRPTTNAANAFNGHIIGLTYDAQATDIQERLKLTWAMEHSDRSHQTGITLFDFDNDDAKDLCYRDETTLRVISPKRGNYGAGSGYVTLSETTNTPGASVMFSTPIYGGTGFEYPTIADVNMDGSADILVTQSITYQEISASQGWINVYEYDGHMWAPCPPVWNQSLYNPLHINDDLTVPAKPISMLTKFYDGTDSIRPYNGSWIQQPIVREGEDYIPIYRHPDAVLINMNVEISGGNTKIKVTIRNDGLASINANTPIYFYHTTPGSSVKSDETILPVGHDIFPNEKIDLEYTITGSPSGTFTHCHLVHDGTNFPAAGYRDCRIENNYGYTSVIRAVDDYETVFLNNDKEIYVTANDSIIGNPIIEIITGAGNGPHHGVADTIGSKILYTPDLGFQGKDTLRYILKCKYDGDTLMTTDTAYVYILVVEKPNNIIDAECFVISAGTTWSIKEATLNKTQLVHNYGPLTVGDIDNDGIVEMIGYKEAGGNSNNYESPGLKIFYYSATTNQIELKREFLFATVGGATSATFGAMAIARYDDTTHIVVAGTDKYLYAYDVHGSLIWKSNAPYNANGAGTLLGIADFNNDGVPEVYTGNQIYSLSNGLLLCDGGTSNSSGVLLSATGHSTVAVDMNGDGKLELVAGVNMYDITITNNNGTSGNSIDLLPGMQLTATLPANAVNDGATQVADIDNDGKLEVVVVSRSTGNRCVVYVWKPLSDNRSYIMGSYLVPYTGVSYYSIPMLGNIDDTPYPEIVFITNATAATDYRMYALRFDPLSAAGNQITDKWHGLHTDGSGCTGATLFDFNQDNRSEIVYRDQTQLRIFDGDGQVLPGATFDNVISGTLREYPVIADVDNDGQAEIIVTGWDGVANTVGGTAASGQNGYLRVFKTDGSSWAPARTVWNQYAYNAVNVNDDLTIPRYQLNPATLFPGEDGMYGTGDDVRPYNGFLQQQTVLSKNGNPVWVTPDVITDESLIHSSVSGNSVTLTVGMMNRGDVALGSPVYVTLYKESVSGVNKIGTGSANIQIMPGDTGYVTVTIPDIRPYLPMINIIAKINDNGNTFLNHPECDSLNNELAFLNPAISLMMEKNATLNGTPDNGTYPNPVSVLYSEDIAYSIKAVNVNTQTGTVIIRDTLPAYLRYKSNSGNPLSALTVSSSGNIPNRDVLTWTLTGIDSQKDTTVYYEASPMEGVCASQPLFINKAWIIISDTIRVMTGNRTYHQGAGVGVVTFSAGFGGQLYNAEPQAVDYRTSASEGIIIVPEEGYEFTGWSHDDYMSLRGKMIKAEKNITRYDTLTVYGNVELKANFEPETYPIEYILNNGENTANNPLTYTIKTGTILLEAPEKQGDIFIGWTGSNGIIPQMQVSIPAGSKGERTYYANFRNSGREETRENRKTEENVWSSGNTLYVKTLQSGKTIYIYSADGILQKQQTLLSGTTKIQLPGGIYIVTLNSSIGRKVKIE